MGGEEFGEVAETVVDVGYAFGEVFGSCEREEARREVVKVWQRVRGGFAEGGDECWF